MKISPWSLSLEMVMVMVRGVYEYCGESACPGWGTHDFYAFLS